ncbi:Activating signal cointegrator 1 [Rhynchospora pubera]|uniref:Activating signal cointegrator 1 n=1 Tax=Rhynchospora pubera TaxID=906938 RepID=A0AAV8GBH1_9POAL|nr:Activating signal cointegrator 1 [Rhynchospora pubera]
MDISKDSRVSEREKRCRRGQWLEEALHELSGKIESGLQLDGDLISGLVSFCELAPPSDAADYIKNIIGEEAGRDVIQGYLQKRGHVDPSAVIQNTQAHTQPSSSGSSSSKKPSGAPQEAAVPPVSQNPKSQPEVRASSSKAKKKKAGKAISLAEAAKGSVVFKKGKPCACQARRHALVSNCLSCGKIVCEQEGEGPCSFCGALVLKEGSTYAGLTEFDVPLTKEEAAAEEFAKRLVDYDRNSAARTKVIDDQSDYYEIEGNSWLSTAEKEVIMKKQKEAEEAAEAKKKNVIITFDLVGRKVVVNKDEASDLESDLSILRPPPPEERDINRIKPNPTVKVQPMFVKTGPVKKPIKGKENKKLSSGLCLEITGQVQPDDNRQLKNLMGRGKKYDDYGSGADFVGGREGDDVDCSHDYY